MTDMKIALLYRVSAWSLVAAVVIGLSLNLVVAKAGAASVNNLPVLIKLPLSLIGAAGALGLFALWPGMIWHCLVVHKGRVATRIGWIVLLLLTIPFGALTYYYLVFQKAQTVRTSDDASGPV
jgi:hypothetical protein